MITAATTKTDRTAATLAAVVCAASERAANDNAGLAWRVTDALPYTDDARCGVEVRTRTARMAAPVVGGTVGAAWRVEARGAAVRVRPTDEWSRAVARRVRTAVAFARAAGLDAVMD